MADGVCCWHLCFMRGDRIRFLWPCFALHTKAPAATPNRNQQEINSRAGFSRGWNVYCHFTVQKTAVEPVWRHRASIVNVIAKACEGIRPWSRCHFSISDDWVLWVDTTRPQSQWRCEDDRCSGRVSTIQLFSGRRTLYPVTQLLPQCLLLTDFLKLNKLPRHSFLVSFLYLNWVHAWTERFVFTHHLCSLTPVLELRPWTLKCNWWSMVRWGQGSAHGGSGVTGRQEDNGRITSGPAVNRQASAWRHRDNRICSSYAKSKDMC